MPSHGIDQVHNLKFILPYINPGNVDLRAWFRVRFHLECMCLCLPGINRVWTGGSFWCSYPWPKITAKSHCWFFTVAGFWQESPNSLTSMSYCSSIENHGLHSPFPYSWPGNIMGTGICPWKTSMPISIRFVSVVAGIWDRTAVGTGKTTPDSPIRDHQHIVHVG